MIALKDMVKHSRLRSLLSTFLDFLFPKQFQIRALEGMSHEDFSALPRATPRADDWIKPIFSYKDNKIKELIWQIKYKKNGKLVEKAADILTEEIRNDLTEIVLFESAKKPLLIPIPLSIKRLRERGFNQTELIGKEIAHRITHLEYRTDLLIKDIHTTPQTHTKTREERLLNTRGCFKVTKPNDVKKRTVLLLDDVTTTGATLLEARKTLLKAGAKKVIAYTIAH